MIAPYSLLALGLILLTVLLDIVLRTDVLQSSKAWFALLVLLALTLIFDSILTHLPLVGYDRQLLSGIYIGSIPLEDFSYTFVIAFLPRIIMKYNG